MLKSITSNTAIPIGFALFLIGGFFSLEKVQDMAIAGNTTQIASHRIDIGSLGLRVKEVELDSKHSLASIEAKLSIALQDLAMIKGELKNQRRNQ